MQQAKGEFDVTMTPQGDPGVVPGRMSIDKNFRGDLEGTSMGQMLMSMGSVKGSAGYVALEQVVGTLATRTGSFVLQHSGTMTRGVPTLSVTVVPDSGTGDMVGLAGQMTIDASGGKHAYNFEYSFSEEE